VDLILVLLFDELEYFGAACIQRSDYFHQIQDGNISFSSLNLGIIRTAKANLPTGQWIEVRVCDWDSIKDWKCGLETEFAI